MGNRSRGAVKVLTIFSALLMGAGIIALAGSMLLPSTKRARIDWEKVREGRSEAVGPNATAPTTAATPEPHPTVGP